MKKTISLKLEKHQLDHLEKKRKDFGVNVNEQIRRLIQAQIDEEKKNGQNLSA